MRRHVKIILRSLSLLSAAMGVAIVVLWVRSYSTQDALPFQRGGWRWEVSSAGGTLAIDDRPQVDAEEQQRKARHDAWLDETRALYFRKFVLEEEYRQAYETHRESARVGEFEARIARHMKEADRISKLVDASVRQQQRNTDVYSIPHWAAAAGTTLLPLVMVVMWWLNRRRRRLRQAPGLCTSCGYDVRFSAERCPECGTEIGGAEGKTDSSTPGLRYSEGPDLCA